MLLTWKIRYLDRNDGEFKDRYLHLDTATLKPAAKAAIELIVEAKTSRTERQILKYRHIFIEGDQESHVAAMGKANTVRSVGPTEYFEDGEGNEITHNDIARLLTGNANAISVPSGAEQHDVELAVAEPTPIPIAEITLSANDCSLLGYFTRDCQELCESAFMTNGPGSITWQGSSNPSLETATTDDEIRSFVTIFRRLYMAREPASFLKAVASFTDALGDHRYSKWVAGAAGAYERDLNKVPELRPFVPKDKCSFTRKRLIDVFIYTQYAHQPSVDRQRQYVECLNQVDGKTELLTWMFLTEIWRTCLELGNAGRVIAAWFRRYCEHHQVSVDVLPSLSHENPGIGTQEKEADRTRRLFREKAQELATELWNQNGRPNGGSIQFLPAAQEQLREALEAGIGADEITPLDLQADAKFEQTGVENVEVRLHAVASRANPTLRIALDVLNTGKQPLFLEHVTFVQDVDEPGATENGIPFHELSRAFHFVATKPNTESLGVGEKRMFILTDDFMQLARDIAAKHPPEKYWVAVTTHRGEIARIDGRNVSPFLVQQKPSSGRQGDANRREPELT